MPMYDFLCENGHKFERLVKLKDFSVVQICSCQSPAKRLISAPRIQVESVGYNCPITGTWIGSKRQHEDNLSRHGCRVLETGEREAAAQFRQRQEEEFDRKIEDTVEREIEHMPSAKKEALATELLRGNVDLAVERGTAQ